MRILIQGGREQQIALLARGSNVAQQQRHVVYARALDVPLGLQSWWQGSHQGCPFGTVPFTTTKKVTVCELWGLAAEGREWVQDVPGTAFGHWVYTNVHGVCLASHEVEVEVTECLPRLTLTTP